MRIYLYLTLTIFVLVLKPFAFAQDWGPPLGNLHCRVELQKEVFSEGEPIMFGFRIEPLKGLPKDIGHLLPYEKKGLIEKLKIVGPNGKRLPLKVKLEYPPAGKFYTSFNVSHYYDFKKQGEYLITAQYPLETNGSAILRSQTIILVVVPDDLIIVTIRNGAKKLRTTDPIPLTVNLSTSGDNIIELESVRIRFEMGTFWSCPVKSTPVPSQVALTKKAKSYGFDISSTGWDHMASSVWQGKPLARFVKPGDRQYLVSIISGKYEGKRFELNSEPVMLEFVNGNKEHRDDK